MTLLRRACWLLACCFCWSSAYAEQEYFTWVDAQGRIHNTPVERSDKSAQKTPPVSTSASASSGEVQADQNPVTDNFLTEEEFEKKTEQYESDNPPFYTFVDETGRLRSQPIIDSDIVVEDTFTPQTFDHILAPPFRVSKAMGAQCCQRYRNYFKEKVPPAKVVNFDGFLNVIPLVTRTGANKAWYVALDRSVNATTLFIDLGLTFRGTNTRSTNTAVSDPIAFIAVNRQFQALHFVPNLIRTGHEESWAGASFERSELRIEDPQVAGFVVYFPQPPADSVSMDVEWHYGKTSD
ncbi:DUF4124 domain-containing protein [Bacterioplanoides sp.]|uniref:DUF4124 domain-containing protein n=1 Tax=Bacterioplanoides sp. TaxID=2066072 RepID=UPI003B005A3B